jgi:ubiquinone/menaquinone biosynthesis C-methylase UbiE
VRREQVETSMDPSSVPPAQPPDWQLPLGVNRGLWDYLHDPAIASNYDSSLAGTALFNVDQQFVERHCPRPGRIIDLGCGTGRLLVAMTQRGWWTLGVDLSESMLAHAAEKARQAGVAVHLMQANLTQLDALAEKSFDRAACLFSTLGMIQGRAARRQMMAHVFRLLRPGGRFVLHVHNRWFSIWNAPGRRWLLANAWRAWRGQDEAGRRVMPVHQGVAGLALHLFTRRETVRLLQAAGFRMIEVKPISLRPDGRLPCAWWLGGLRAYGYLLAAERPA